LTGEGTTQPDLRATSRSVCVDFELSHQLQRCYCFFVVPEICEVPAPLKEELKTTAATDQHDFYQCRFEVLQCWKQWGK